MSTDLFVFFSEVFHTFASSTNSSIVLPRLTTLDISGNTVSTKAADSFAHLLSTAIGAFPRLNHLKIAGCGPEWISKLLPVLEKRQTTLRVFDMSRTIIKKLTDFENTVHYLLNTSTLQDVDLSQLVCTGAAAGGVEGIVAALICNRKAANITLRLNHIESAFPDVMVSRVCGVALSLPAAIGTLHLAWDNLGVKGLCSLASALTYSHPETGPSKIHTLYIDGNVRSTLSEADHRTVGKAIAGLVDPSKGLKLKYLSIRGGGGLSQPEFSADLSELMESIGNNRTLTTLDVSGNSFQDKMLVSLCKGLARNNLHTCLLEDTPFTLIELQKMRDSLQLKRGASLRSIGKLSFAASDVKSKGTKVLQDVVIQIENALGN